MILFAARRRAVAPFIVVVAGVVSAVVATPCTAQDREGRTIEREVRIVRNPDGISVTRSGSGDRAVLGVMLGEGSRADTAGVRVDNVEANGPAAKAGIKAGDVITDINGTSLRVAREDAEDLALTGLAQRRLQRVMAKAKPGDEVKLQLRSGNGTARTVTVKTVSAMELDRLASADRKTDMMREEEMIVRSGDGAFLFRPTPRSATPARERAMVGVSVGSAGNARDTLGLFVSGVVTGGPAEKAGIIEGERIAAVNGVDVRIPREDLDDMQVASARVDRFVREVQQAEPGKTLSIRVYGNGRYRDVTVTAGKASELPGAVMRLDGELPGMRFESLPEGEMRIRRNGGEPQLFEFRRDGGEPRVFEFRRDGPRARIRIDGNALELDGEAIERAIEGMGRNLQERITKSRVVRTAV